MAKHASSDSPRAQLMLKLKPALPSKWRLQKYEDNTDEPDRPIVKVRQRSVSRMPQAPRGFYVTRSVLELIVPQMDPELAEDYLDEILFDFLDILDAINPNLWVTTEKVLDRATQRLAYDVTIDFTTTKDLTS